MTANMCRFRYSLHKTEHFKLITQSLCISVISIFVMKIKVTSYINFSLTVRTKLEELRELVKETGIGLFIFLVWWRAIDEKERETLII